MDIVLPQTRNKISMKLLSSVERKNGTMNLIENHSLFQDKLNANLDNSYYYPTYQKRDDVTTFLLMLDDEFNVIGFIHYN